MTRQQKRLLASLMVLAALVFLAGMTLASKADASAPERVRETQPTSCNGQRCVQLRTVTIYSHGQDTLVITKRRTAPAEARTPNLPIPWRSWHVVSAMVLPCCGGH
jgi:hypothetical protein